MLEHSPDSGVRFRQRARRSTSQKPQRATVLSFRSRLGSGGSVPCLCFRSAGIKSVSATEPEPTRKTCLSNVCVLTYLRALRASRGGEISPRPSRVQHRREIEAVSIAASKARQANHRVRSARPSVRHRSLRILNSHAIRTHISKPKRPRGTPNTRIATTACKCAATRGNVFDNARSVRQDGRRFVALLGISGG